MSTISQLTSVTSVASGDLFVVVDVDDTTMAPTGTDKNITAGNLLFGVPQIVATTGTSGYTMINGTGTILSWTAPNDGNLHVAMLHAILHTTVSRSGGAVTFGSQNSGGGGQITPDNAAAWVTPYAGGEGNGALGPENTTSIIVGPGKTLYLYQSSAQTAGTAVLFAAILAW